MDAIQIAKAIRSYRDRNGRTLRQVADKCKMELTQLWLLENTRVKRPTAKTVNKLIKAGIIDTESCAGCDPAN